MGRINQIITRAKYAAAFAAIGAFIGGLISRNAASTGGALGALIGAKFGEFTSSNDTLQSRMKGRAQSAVSSGKQKASKSIDIR